MNRLCGGNGCKSQARFILRFQRRLLEARAEHRSVAEGFGRAWEKALEEIPLEERDQAQVYWPLIAWAKNEELFTTPPSQPLLNYWNPSAPGR